MLDKIAFYTYKEIVALGDNAYYFTFADSLLKCKKVDEVYCIHPSPVFRKNNKNAKIKFSDLELTEDNDFNNATFFLPLNSLLFFLSEAKKFKNAKVMFFSASPYTFTWLFRVLKVDEKNFITFLKNKSCIAFQDLSCFLPAKPLFGKKYVPSLLPMFISKQTGQKYGGLVSKKSINIGWLGRLDSGDKLNAFINVCNNLLDINSDRKIIFHIIGDGNMRKRFNVNNYTAKITFVWNSFLFGEKTRRYLEENVDLCISMGTSAIYSSQIGIPTVIPVVSSQSFNDSRFIYFFNTKGFSICWDQNSLDNSNCKTNCLQKIIDDIYTNNKKIKYGRLCKKMVDSQFNVKKNTERSYKIISSTQLKISDLLKIRAVKRDLAKYKLYKMFHPYSSYYNYFLFCDKIRYYKSLNFKDKIKRIVSIFQKKGK